MLSALILLFFMVILYLTTILCFLVSSFFAQATKIYIYFCFFRLLLLYLHDNNLMSFWLTTSLYGINFISLSKLFDLFYCYTLYLKKLLWFKIIFPWFYNVLFLLNKHNVPFKIYISWQKCSPYHLKNFVAHMLECITSATPFTIFKKRPTCNFNKII